MPRLLEARHAVQIGAPEGRSSWLHALPSGTFSGRDGRGPYKVGDAHALIAATLAYLDGQDMAIDYEHQLLEAATHSGPVPAAGWVQAMEAREDGIWLLVDWTEVAAASLAAKEVRYFSPVFDYDPATGEVFRLKLGALTNIPNLKLQAAASRQGDAMDELLERLRYILNLPLTSTTEEIAAHLEKLKGMISGAEATAAASAVLATALGLDAATPLPDLATAAQSRLGQAPDPAQYVPKAQYDQVAHSLNQLQTEQRQGETQRLVQEAMASGKVAPAQKDWATAYASQDPAGFKTFLEKAPVLVSPHSQIPLAPAKGTVLSDDQVAMCRMFGHDPETIANAIKED